MGGQGQTRGSTVKGREARRIKKKLSTGGHAGM